MEEVIEVDIRFQTPTIITVVGSTSSGKTSFIYKLLQNKDSLFDRKIDNILYCYSCDQPIYEDFLKSFEGLKLHKDLPDEEKIREFSRDQHNVIILDDLMTKVTSSQTMLDLFCQFSHHLNITVIFVSQNLFQSGKCSRTLALNSHYYVLFRNRRDINQIGCLGRQLFPGKQKKFLQIYQDATKEPYGFLLVDIHPQSLEKLSLRSDIFNDKYIIIYEL